MRLCRKCDGHKPSSEFRPGRSACRKCENARARDYGKANRAHRNARLRRWRRSNPDSARAVDKRKRLGRYGLTEAAVAAMLEAQGGLCAICGSASELVIDHCHETGRVRALLCTPCNNGLGWVESRSVSLDHVAAYLDQPCHADVLLELANA